MRIRVALPGVLLLAAMAAFGRDEKPPTPPFPKSDVPAEGTPVRGEKFTPAHCDPVYYFIAAVLYPDNDKGKQFEEPVRLTSDGLTQRGFTPLAWPPIQAGPKYKNIDAIFQALKDAIHGAPKFCECDDDELVIVIGTHGNTDGIYFQNEGEDENKKSFDEFAKRLADMLEGMVPKKLYIIVEACSSGALFQGHFPISLTGAHLVTSTSDETGCSHAEFGKTLGAALLAGDDKTWTDVIHALKKEMAKLPAEPAPKNGDINSCRTRVTVKKITYHGTADAGPLGSGIGITVNGNAAQAGGKLSKPDQSTSPDTVVYDQPSSDPSILQITVDAGTTNGNGALPPMRKSYKCPSKTPEKMDIPLKCGGKDCGSVTVNLEVDVH